MSRETIRYFVIAAGDGYAFGMTEDGRYVYAGFFGGTQMTELYEIGRERYECFTDAENTDRSAELIQDIYAECECIAFQGSRTEPLPVKIPKYGTVEECMEYLSFISTHHVTSGRVEDGRLTLTAEDASKCFVLAEQEE